MRQINETNGSLKIEVENNAWFDTFLMVENFTFEYTDYDNSNRLHKNIYLDTDSFAATKRRLHTLLVYEFMVYN